MLQRSFWGAARLLAASVMWAWLASCGGSGGGADPGTPPPAAAAPVITQQPAGKTAPVSASVTFSVSVQAAGTVTYQWLRNGTELAGANAGTYVLAYVRPEDSFSQWVVRVTNAAGSVTSSPALLMVTPSPEETPVGLSLLAGETAGAGYVDHVHKFARFNGTLGMAADAQNNIYVADTGNQAIRKVTLFGSIVSTVPFNTPSVATLSSCSSKVRDLAFAGDGQLYAVNHDGSAICRRGMDGQVTQVLAQQDAAFFFIARGPGDSLYVAKRTEIYRFVPGAAPTLVAGMPFEVSVDARDGTGAGAMFAAIEEMAVDGAGNIFVIDAFAMVRRITPGGVVTTLARREQFAQAEGVQTMFHLLTGIAVDSAGQVFVADRGVDITLGGGIYKVSPAGAVSKVFAAVRPFRAGHPPNLAFDGIGQLYYGNGLGLGRFLADGTHEQVAGRWLAGPFEPVNSAPFAVDAQGNLFTLGSRDRRPEIRKYSPSGQQLPFGPDPRGLGLAPVEGYGTLAVAMDPTGAIYVAYSGAVEGFFRVPKSGEIYRISPAGETSLVLSSRTGDPDFVAPTAIAFDPQGGMYLLDAVTMSVLKRAPDGTLTPVSAPNSVGQANHGNFSMAVNASGTVYLAESLHKLVFKVDPDGTVTAFAGMSSQPAVIVDGRGTAARFIRPAAPVVDAAGNLYVTDNATVRKITPAGDVTTVVGQPSLSGIELGPLPGSLDFVTGLAFGHDGVLYLGSGGAILKARWP